MKTKKLIALAMSAALMLAPMSAFASQNNITTPGGGDISGDVNYVNTTVYQVTLPTTAGMNFTLDPQGLSSLLTGSYSASDAGLIFSNQELHAINESSVALNLKSTFYVEDSTGTLSLLGLDDTIDNAKQEIKLVIQSSATTRTGFTDKIAVTGTTVDTASVYTESMAAATYTFDTSGSGFKYELTPGSGSDLYMQIAGQVAKDYNWDAYNEDATIKLKAVFKFEDANVVTENSIAGGDYKRNLSTNGYAVTWKNDMDPSKKTIKSLTYGLTEANCTLTPGSGSYKLSDDKNTLILTTSSFGIGEAAVGSPRYIKVTFGDNSVVTFSVNVKAN